MANSIAILTVRTVFAHVNGFTAMRSISTTNVVTNPLRKLQRKPAIFGGDPPHGESDRIDSVRFLLNGSDAMKRSMKTIVSISAFLTLAMVFVASAQQAEYKAAPRGQRQDSIDNPAIDMNGYLTVAQEAAKYRESHRLTEEEFLRMSKEEGTIVLDARSKEKYNQLHIKGAINLSFPDIAIETLKHTLPDKSARILIYCNNNFKGAKYTDRRGPFPSKQGNQSLNISTYISLYSYGYRNVYELGPQLNPEQSILPFEPAIAKK